MKVYIAVHTVKPLYCGHLRDLVKCLYRRVFISGANYVTNTLISIVSLKRDSTAVAFMMNVPLAYIHKAAIDVFSSRHSGGSQSSTRQVVY